MNKKTAYTIGRTEGYDKSLADKTHPSEEDGVHRLINSAVIVEKVLFINLTEKV